jgi:hypothetical protein
MVQPGLQVGLIMTQSPIYVHPPSALGPEGSDPSRYDKIVTGHVVVSATTVTRIGPIKLAWDVSHHPDVDTRIVLARYECTCRPDDSSIPSGDTRFVTVTSIHALIFQGTILPYHIPFTPSLYSLTIRSYHESDVCIGLDSTT